MPSLLDKSKEQVKYGATKDPGSGAVLVGQGQGKKSENRKLMDEIMNPNVAGGPCRGPHHAGCGHDKKKK